MPHRSAVVLALLLIPALSEAVVASGLTSGNPEVWFGVERRVDPVAQ